MKVIKAGIQDTIQDQGRWGTQAKGINPGGAMDIFAMQIANILVGNDASEAVVEMHFPASAFFFNESAMIALAGADFAASINGDPIPLLHPIIVLKNDVLHFHKPVSGARVYLALRGGFKVNEWLGSTGTNLRAKVGGYHGRSLQKNDELLFKQALKIFPVPEMFKILPWSVELPKDVMIEKNVDSHRINVLQGNEWDRLAVQAKENFLMTSFFITQQSDRMGYRLNNIPLPALVNEEMLSSGVGFGTIQLLPDGKLIILMAGHQTTGGYPKIAHVISGHRSRLAQLKAGDKLHFTMVDQREAEKLYVNQVMQLHQLQYACAARLDEYLAANPK
jgi:antagonist of KipI